MYKEQIASQVPVRRIEHNSESAKENQAEGVDGNEPNDPATRLTESIRDLLRGAPKRFKEMYPMIAERQPEDCPAHGNKVSLASMGWLHQIQRELQEIAVNRMAFGT